MTLPVFTLANRGGRRRARRLEVGRTPAARFQQLLGASEVVAHVPFAAVIPTRIAVAIGDGLPSRVDDRDEPQDTPPISRVFDVAVLQVGLADGVDGAAPTA